LPAPSNLLTEAANVLAITPYPPSSSLQEPDTKAYMVGNPERQINRYATKKKTDNKMAVLHRCRKEVRSNCYSSDDSCTPKAYNPEPSARSERWAGEEDFLGQEVHSHGEVKAHQRYRCSLKVTDSGRRSHACSVG